MATSKLKAQRAVIQRLDAMPELPDGANQYYDKCLPRRFRKRYCVTHPRTTAVQVLLAG